MLKNVKRLLNDYLPATEISETAIEFADTLLELNKQRILRDKTS
jgi:hypothetical protein